MFLAVGGGGEGRRLQSRYTHTLGEKPLVVNWSGIINRSRSYHTGGDHDQERRGGEKPTALWGGGEGRGGEGREGEGKEVATHTQTHEEERKLLPKKRKTTGLVCRTMDEASSQSPPLPSQNNFQFSLRRRRSGSFAKKKSSLHHPPSFFPGERERESEKKSLRNLTGRRSCCLSVSLSLSLSLSAFLLLLLIIHG